MNITVVGGSGYVGLITGVGFAELGHNVIGLDLDGQRVAQLNKGSCYLHEEGLETALRENLAARRIRFTSDYADAIQDAATVFVAVGTPAQSDGQADLSQVINVVNKLVPLIRHYLVVVVKSTVPVGTVELVRDIMRRDLKEGVEFDIVANPEFLREGNGLQDFFHPSRIVIGVGADRARSTMRKLYAPFLDETSMTNGEQVSHPVPYLETDLPSAQMIKYASNAFLAMRVSFINEVAGISQRVGANIRDVVNGLGYDSRIGHHYLEPGLGFGGPCLGKDLRALIQMARANDYEPHVLSGVLNRNERQLADLVGKVKQQLGYLLYGKVIAVFGLAFKAGTNDVRDSMALRAIELLKREGAIIRAHDPLALEEARLAMVPADLVADPYEAAQGADCLLILTKWPEYRTLDWERVKASMAQPCLVDASNLLDPALVTSLGFRT